MVAMDKLTTSRMSFDAHALVSKLLPTQVIVTGNTIVFGQIKASNHMA